MAGRGPIINIGELDIGLDLLDQKVKQARKLLSLEGFSDQVPKRIKQDFAEIEKSLDALFKNKPGSNATTKELNKYTKDLEKLGNQLDTTFSHISSTKIDVSGLQDTLKVLKDLKKQTEEANEAYTKYKENLGSKGALDPDAYRGKFRAAGKAREASAGYHDDIESAEKKAITAAQSGASQSEIAKIYQPLKNKLNKRVVDIGENDLDQVRDINELLQNIETRIKSLAGQSQYLKGLGSQSETLQTELSTKTQVAVEDVKKEIEESAGSTKEASATTEQLASKYRQLGNASADVDKVSHSLDNVSSRIKNLFSSTMIFMTVRRMIRSAVNDFKELDKQFNEIAIVSKYSTKEMWSSFSQVNKMAQEYGVTTKDILEVQNLYYHQGKEMAEVNKLTAQTLTLAKITGMDYADATNKMTAALNAYKISADDASRVTDTVAALSANAATSSEELMTALTKTASIAANAGMSLENTEIFLTKMIETTREAPENLGTALKTIVARFGEVKNAIDENGDPIEVADINKVDKALKTVGISLLDTAGQVRDLDDVFMELSSKWDGLDRNTQRYIATQAAGSRQQSRFIAMMENYDRTLELTEVAQDSAGTGARQLAKAQESIETALNRLKSTWQELYSNILKSGMIRGVLDAANAVLTVLNKLPGPLGAVALGMGVWATKSLVVDKGLNSLIRTLKVFSGDISATAAAQEAMATKGTIFDRFAEGKQHLQHYKQAMLGITTAQQANITTQMVANGLDEESMQLTLEKAGIEEAEAKIQAQKISMNIQEALTSQQLADKELAMQAIKESGLAEDQKSIALKKLNELWDKKEIATGKTKNASMLKTILFNKVMNSEKLKGTKAGQRVVTAANAEAASYRDLALAELEAYWPLILIAVAVAAVIAVYKNFIQVNTDHTQQIDKAREATDKYKDSLKELKDSQEDFATYQKLNDRLIRTQEEEQKLQEVIEALIEKYPTLLDFIDEEGNYHIKEEAAIQKAIDQKKEDTKALEENSLALQQNLALRGLSATSTAKANAQTLTESFASAQGIDVSDTKKASRAIARKTGDFIYGDTGATSTDWGYKTLVNSLGGAVAAWFPEIGNQRIGSIEALLKGEGINQETIHGFMGKALKMSQKDYQDFIKEVQGKDIGNVKDMEKVFSKIYGDTLGETYAKAFVANTKDFKDIIQADLNTQEEEIKNVLQQQIYDWLNMENYDFPVDKTGLKKLADAFVQGFEGDSDEIEKHKQEILNAVAGLSEEDYNRVISALDMEDLALGQLNPENFENTIAGLLGQDFDNSNPIHQGILKWYEQNYKLSEEERARLAEIFGQETIETLTYAQGKAATDQISRITEKTGDENQAISYYKQAYAIGNSYDKNRTDIFNAINAASIESISDLDELVNKLQTLGVTSKDAENIVMSLGGGLDNLPLDNTSQMVELLNSKMEDLNTTIESLNNLAEGKGSLTDLQRALSLLTENLHGDEFMNMLSSITSAATVSADGIKLNAEQIAEMKNLIMTSDMDIADVEKALLDQQIANVQAEIEGYIAELEAKEVTTEGIINLSDQALQAMAATNAGIKTEIDSLIAARATLENLQANRAIIDFSSILANKQVDNIGKSISNAAKDTANKAKDAADKAKKAWEDFVKWLRDFDKYANLDRVISTLEEKLGHIEFEISFSTNEKVIERDLKKQMNIINKEVAANGAGMDAARKQMQVWREVIQRRNSGYVTFDADDNAIVNANKLKKLQEQIRDANEQDAEVLKHQYDEIMDNVEAYEKEKKKVEEYSKALEQSMNKLLEFAKETYEKITTLEEKLISVRQAQEDKELQRIKDRYALMQEENDKYLESVRKMVDKEREIRDRAQQEEDIKQKERKLAMMQMDTSGIYASQIKSLQKELKQDYQDREDSSVDKALNELEEQLQTVKERQDKETEFLENALNDRRELMIVYNEWVAQLMETNSKNIINYLEQNDQEYLTATQAKQGQLRTEYETTASQGVAAFNFMISGGLIPIQVNLEIARQQANSFEEAVKQYSKTTQVENGNTVKSVSGLRAEYEKLVGAITGANGLCSALETLTGKYQAAANAASAAASAARDYASVGGGGSVSPKTAAQSTSGNNKTSVSYQVKERVLKDSGAYNNANAYAWQTWGGSIEVGGIKYIRVYTTFSESANKDPRYVKASDLPRGYNSVGDSVPPGTPLYVLRTRNTNGIRGNISGGGGGHTARAYASGGMVDFTGPAWVDGTKTKPEAFLSAQDTANIAALRDTLAFLYNRAQFQPSPSLSQTSNATYSINIHVDSIANDYDVDKAISRIEENIQKSSKYRNINILKQKN